MCDRFYVETYSGDGLYYFAYMESVEDGGLTGVVEAQN
jgi:hypothetical protein